MHERVLLSLICFLLIGGPWSAVGIAADADRPPNILMIAIDDQNDWIGCLGGHPQIQTPFIDQLAERGTLFLNAHCQSPLCNPSRTSLMTGRRPSTTGVYGLAPWFRQVEELRELVSLPQHLSQHGWKTLTAGKIYHGRNGRQKKDREFDVIGPPAGVLARPERKLVDTPANHPLPDRQLGCRSAAAGTVTAVLSVGRFLFASRPVLCDQSVV